MADGYARSTGRPGVLCVVPGPGRDQLPDRHRRGAARQRRRWSCIVGDVARGDKYKPFQVHELPQVGLLQQVTKGVFAVDARRRDPRRRRARRSAWPVRRAGADGRRRAVQPAHRNGQASTARRSGRRDLPFDEAAFARAPATCCANRKLRVGIYAGMGCMDCAAIAGRRWPSCCRPRWPPASPARASSPSAIRWRSAGATGRRARAPPSTPSSDVDLVLAIGVRYSEVSTGFYSIPHAPLPDPRGRQPRQPRPDRQAERLRPRRRRPLPRPPAGRTPTTCAGRPTPAWPAASAHWKREEAKEHADVYARCGVDPMAVPAGPAPATCPTPWSSWT